MARNSEYTYQNNENQSPDKQKQKSVHIYSTPLLSIVAIMKVAIKNIKPVANTLIRNSIPDTNCPITNAANTNLPTSYSALANSLRWAFSKVITLLTIVYRPVFVKIKLGFCALHFMLFLL